MEFFGYPNNDTARHKIINLLIQGIRSGDEILEAVVANAAQVVNAPIALITFVHRHQLMHLSKYGIEADSSSAEDSFCIHHLTEAEFTEISDTMLDLKFSNNPSVAGAMHIRFYAGAPLVVEQVPIGRLCVLDLKPRVLTTHQRQTLTQLAIAVSEYLQSIYSETIDRFHPGHE